MHASDPVNRIMTEPVLTIEAGESLEEALRLFTSYPVHHLPVVEAGRIVGMLSSADVAKLQFFLPPPGEARSALLKDRWPVKKVMRSPATTVAEHESAQRAAELMATKGIHSLPVVNSKGVLIGIVTTTDVMHFCLNSMPPAADAVRPPSSDNSRIRALENVLGAAKRYLNAGQDERLHTALRRAIDTADLLNQRAGPDVPALGIGG
jgi:CBS domain-containing protein